MVAPQVHDPAASSSVVDAPDILAAATVGELLRARAAATPGAVAARRQSGGAWVAWSWEQWLDQVSSTGMGIASLGLGAGDRVVIATRRVPESMWAIAGCQAIGIVPVVPERVASPGEVADLASATGARAVVLDDCPAHGRTSGEACPSGTSRAPLAVSVGSHAPEAISFDEIAETADRSAATRSDEWLARSSGVREQDPALICGSGRGARAACELSHASLIGAGRSIVARHGIRRGDRIVADFDALPIDQFVYDLVVPALAGAIAFHQAGPQSTAGELRAVEPTIYATSATHLEELVEGVEFAASRSGNVKHFAFRSWKRARSRRLDDDDRLRRRVLAAAGSVFVRRPLRTRCGLRRARVLVCSGPGLSEEAEAFYRAMGVDVRAESEMVDPARSPTFDEGTEERD